MSLKLGTQDIAGISQNTKYNAHHLLDFKWTDCIMNDVSWLRADTFSWQSGDVYVTAYNHLVQDIQGITAETETIGSYTVTFYRATDGHKICLADQEQTVLNIYNTYGIAWYYILDTTNTQFKLPRTKYGFEGLRTNVGDKIDESLPNIKGRISYGVRSELHTDTSTNGVFKKATNTNSAYTGNYSESANPYVDFNASWSSSTYQDNAPVQERATQMYLYFYVGDYTQSAIEQTAGLNSELFNNKADLNFDNMNPSQTAKDTIIGWGVPDYSAGEDRSWQTSYKEDVDGYAWARGTGTSSSSCSEIQISFDNTNWTIIANVYTNNTVGSNACCMTPIPKGIYWRAWAGGGGRLGCKFYPKKGAN